jgi:putative oxidoreductase
MVERQLHPSPAERAERLWHRVQGFDKKVLAVLERAALPLLRMSLGLVFVWFGLLKVIGQTPVAELVANTAYWLDPTWLVPLLGAFEVVVGVVLLLARALRLVLALFALQMLGTLLVLIIQPEVAFQHSNPLLLTTEGEFVVKNLVLLSAGLMIGSRLKGLPKWTGQ